MRILLFLFIMFIASTLKAQEGYVFTKEQHDQIRKNLADYKILIKDYDDLSLTFKKYTYKLDSINRQFLLYKELHSKTNSEVKRFEVLYQNSEYENEKLKNQIEILKKKLLDTEPEMARKDRIALHWKAKYAHERRYDKGERIIANAFWALFTSCAILGIYTEIDNRIHH